MAYDGLTNYFIVNELKSHLIDGKIDIFQSFFGSNYNYL